MEIIKDDYDMLDDYSHLTGWQKNPYNNKLSKNLTISLDDHIVDFFEKLAEKKGVKCEKLIAATLKNYIIHIEQLTNF